MSNDNGLVDEFEKLESQIEEINKKKEELKIQIIALSKEKNINILFGKNKKCLIKEYEKVVYPENKEFLIRIIRDKGLYEELSQISYPRLSSRIIKNQLDSDILNLVKKEKDFRLAFRDIK